MSNALTPSPMLELFVRNVQEQFPEDEADKIARFADKIS
jgi:hypothetical protein